MQTSTDFSYVIPVRWTGDENGRDALADYLDQLVCWCADVIVVDGSPVETFDANASRWGNRIRHVAPDPARQALMGKVSGVLTGVDLARYDRVVLADDDVRY